MREGGRGRKGGREQKRGREVPTGGLREDDKDLDDDLSVVLHPLPLLVDDHPLDLPKAGTLRGHLLLQLLVEVLHRHHVAQHYNVRLRRGERERRGERDEGRKTRERHFVACRVLKYKTGTVIL